MKKLTLLLLAALSGLTASAQTEKGKQWIGGSVSASHNKVEEAVNNTGFGSMEGTRRQNSFQVGPSYTYFVAEKLSLSATVAYTHGHSDQSYINNSNPQLNNATVETTSNGYNAYLHLDKYFLYDNKIGIRTGPYAQYYISNSKSGGNPDYSTVNYDAKAFGAGLSLDFVYFPAKRIALIASLGNLSYSKSKYESESTTNEQTDFGLNFLNNAPSFTFAYVFGK